MLLVVIPNYSILKYSIAQIFFFLNPGYPGDSNSPPHSQENQHNWQFKSTQGKFEYYLLPPPPLDCLLPTNTQKTLIKLRLKF